MTTVQSTGRGTGEARVSRPDEPIARRPSRRPPGSSTRRFAAAAWGLAGILAIVLIWEGYKLLGPADGVVIGDARVLPRTTDLAMPHVWDMIGRLAEPVTRSPSAQPLWAVVALAALTTLGIAAVGWLVGVVVGIGLALVMQRWRIAEWGLLPWIVLSQTVPLIASYLAFFPIAIGALKGLQSPDRIHEELMQTYAAGYLQTLVKLRFPAAVPYLLPALRLGAANAVIGAVVAEVSTGLQGGIGRILIQFAGQASGDPSKAWGPIFGAIVLGLVAAGSVALLGVILRNYRRTEEAA